LRKRKLLLVDDDDAVLVYLTAKLARHFHVVATLDPYRALSLARSQHPDLILCDFDMPGMDGPEVAAALGGDAETARIPLVYLTSLVSEEGMRQLDGQVRGRPAVSKSTEVAGLLARITELAPA
jgi:CheY-like chemotaxis protein